MITKTKISHQFFENKAWTAQQFAIGIDEAGRGSFAGPVVVGAVIIPQNTQQPLLRDSKTMSEIQRNEAFAWITKHCHWAVALADHRSIDTHNIYQATLQTMQRAYLQLIPQLPFAFTKLRYVLIDAMPFELPQPLKHKQLEFVHFNYGESVSPSIAAASIVAKVTRDRIMQRLASSFPAYHLEQHKGYGTAEHIATLQTTGPSIIHRSSFTHNALKKDEHRAQTNLFC